MNESTSAQINTQEMTDSAKHLTDWWKLDAAIEKVKAMAANMPGHPHAEERAGEQSKAAVHSQTHHRNCSTDSVHTEQNGHTQITRINFSDRALSIIAISVSSAALAACIGTALHISHAEARMRLDNDFTRRHVEELRIRVEDTDVLVQLAGLKRPGDAISGPANPKRLRKE